MYDNVKCSSCTKRNLVELGADKCPDCGTVGTLALVDGEPNEIFT